MAVSIGKRKRNHGEDDAEDVAGDGQDLKALFQKAFEARFKPLPPSESLPLHAGTDQSIHETSDDPGRFRRL